ncbi:MAG: hypothetical protein J1E35_08625 [Lachnospiraceae bacterium]|nr:hypothetical protein [Lachnospiraceae bacterium]
MDIAFWSSVRHQSGVTSGVAAISLLWAELFKDRITVTSNHICNGGLLERLRGGTEHREKFAKREYCYNFGEPEYFRMLYEKEKGCMVQLNGGMRYISMTGNEEVQMFSGSGLKGVKKQLGIGEYLMIDAACGYGNSSQKILQEAELTVIALPPEKNIVDAFFHSDTFLRQKSFFILGNYRSEASCYPSYLCHKYKIPKERVGMIPYDSAFEQAMEEGSTAAYIGGNINCSRRNGAYHFIHYTKKTAINLRNYVMERRNHVCGDCEKV